MSLVLGIDPSAKKIAIVATDTLTRVVVAEAYVLYKTGSQTPESMGRAEMAMTDFLDKVARISPGDRHAYVEQPVLNSVGIASTVKQAHIGGIIRGRLANAGFRVTDVNQSSWKAHVVNNGRADKPDVARVVKVAWPKAWALVEHDGDLTDAAAICRYGIDSLAGQVRSPGAKRQRKGAGRRTA